MLPSGAIMPLSCRRGEVLFGPVELAGYDQPVPSRWWSIPPPKVDRPRWQIASPSWNIPQPRDRPATRGELALDNQMREKKTNRGNTIIAPHSNSRLPIEEELWALTGGQKSH